MLCADRGQFESSIVKWRATYGSAFELPAEIMPKALQGKSALVTGGCATMGSETGLTTSAIIATRRSVASCGPTHGMKIAFRG
jgi:hypothetical protein